MGVIFRNIWETQSVSAFCWPLRNGSASQRGSWAHSTSTVSVLCSGDEEIQSELPHFPEYMKYKTNTNTLQEADWQLPATANYKTLTQELPGVVWHLCHSPYKRVILLLNLSQHNSNSTCLYLKNVVFPASGIEKTWSKPRIEAFPFLTAQSHPIISPNSSA